MNRGDDAAAKVCTPDKCAYGNFCCPNGCKDEVELDAPSPLLGFPVYEYGRNV